MMSELQMVESKKEEMVAVSTRIPRKTFDLMDKQRFEEIDGRQVEKMSMSSMIYQLAMKGWQIYKLEHNVQEEEA